MVVDGLGTARQALEELTRLDASGAVLALGDDRMGVDGRVDRPLLDGTGDLPPGTQLLRAHVRAWLPAVGALLDELLASAVLVDGGWSEALDVALAHPDLVIVTRNGDRCAGGVWRTGASGTGATGAACEEARARRS